MNLLQLLITDFLFSVNLENKICQFILVFRPFIFLIFIHFMLMLRNEHFEAENIVGIGIMSE